MPEGRPRKYSKKEVLDLKEKFREYISKADIPIIAEFAYRNGILREALYDYDEFSTLRKLCIQKKEAQLEIKALLGEVNSTMAIFSLKQLGWTDKSQTEITGKDGEELVIKLIKA